MAVVKEYTTYARSVSNGTSYTLASHQAPAGANVVVVVAGLFQRNSETDFTVSVTFNSLSMTSLVEQSNTSPSRLYRAGIWMLAMGNVGSTVTADVVATANGTIIGSILAAFTISGAHQTPAEHMPISSTATPVSLAISSSSRYDPWALYVACANAATAGYTGTGDVISPTEVFDLPATDDASTEVGGAGYDYSWSGYDSATATVTITRAGTPPAMVGAGVKFLPAPVGARPPIRRTRTYIRI